MRAKLAEAAPKEGRETRAEADERRRQERRARRRARRRRNQPPPGPTPEEIKRNEIKAEADAILESWRSSFTAGLRAKESSDEELDEKTGKMRKLTVKERKRRRKLRAAAMRRAAAKARGGRLAWMVAAYRKYLASKRADGTRAGREYRIQTTSVDSKGKEVVRPDESGAKFPPSLMDQQAFLVLEQWALHYKITQGEMYKVYEAYYDNLHAKKHPDGAHKVPNRISTYYFQDLFDHQTSEATSLILIPLLFVKELHGLKRARDVGCITFPRFLIAGYEFARQSPCGVILKFFRLLLDPGMISADAFVPLKPFEDLVSLCVEINQCVGSFLGDDAADPARSSGVEVDATMQRERAVNSGFHTGITHARRDPKSAFALVQFIVRGQDARPVSRVDTSLLRLPRAAATAAALPPANAKEVLLVRVLVEASIAVPRSC